MSDEEKGIDLNKPRHKSCLQDDQCCACGKQGGAEVVVEHDDGVLHGYCRPCARQVLSGPVA